MNFDPSSTPSAPHRLIPCNVCASLKDDLPFYFVSETVGRTIGRDIARDVEAIDNKPESTAKVYANHMLQEHGLGV